jgi:hypothetical protein
VDANDFETDDTGRLQLRTHASKMLNDEAIRVIDSGDVSTNPNPDIFEQVIGGFDNVAYTYGNAISAQPGNGRFVINSAGIYHFSAGIGDNIFATNHGATLGLALLVGGATELNVTTDRTTDDKHFLNLSGDVEITTPGTTVRLVYHVELPRPPRGNHFLYPDNRNFFAVHRVGGLNL